MLFHYCNMCHGKGIMVQLPVIICSYKPGIISTAIQGIRSSQLCEGTHLSSTFHKF